MEAHVATEVERKSFDYPRYDFDQFPRLKDLRQKLLFAKDVICIERARYVTEFFAKEGFDEQKPVLRQAKALCYILEHLTPTLFDDELIVGSTTTKRVGMVVYPEFFSIAIWPELPTMARRKKRPIDISDEYAEYLGNVVFPFWKDHTIIETVRRVNNNPEYLRLMERVVFFALTKTNGISHLIPDYQILVKKGLLSLIKDAAKKEKNAEDKNQVEFYKAVQIVFQAVIDFAGRYADACKKEAAKASPERAEELIAAAKTLERVPAHPASTLQEAIQSIWIMQVALHQENSNMALSFGRLDQILNPFYQADKKAGRIDEQKAAELIGCFFLKMGDHMPLAPLASEDIIGGASTDQAVTIGGITPDGKDGANDITFIMLKLSAMLALREPNMCARLHSGADNRYRKALIESVYQNGAAPALYNDEEVIGALQSAGMSLRDARDYGIVGCVEPTSCGRTMSSTGGILLNLAAVLELTLNDGVYPISGIQIGPKTGRFESFKTYDEFIKAFIIQLKHMVKTASLTNKKFGDAHATMHPTPLLSGMIQGTIKNGKDITAGGAKYNTSGVAVIGFSDVADSFSAIYDLVFEKKKISKENLIQAISTNFENDPKNHALLLRKAPKYGTDNPVADMMANDLVERIHAVFAKQKNPRGGPYLIGLWSITMHAGFGTLTGALPNGRKKGMPLASGATPVSGVARKGPTASFASTANLPNEKIANGMANNHKISRSLLARLGKLDLLKALVEGYFAKGGMQTQFTIQDKQTLIAAQKNPEQYRDLLVRVSGYTAYFGDLNRAMQDEIIARTEDAV